MIRSILIVDDESSDRYIASRMVRKAGLTADIHEFANGEEALQFILTRDEFRRACPSPSTTLLFVDINMPRMGGFEFIERLEAAVEGGVVNSACVALMVFSSSLSPLDRKRAQSFRIVNGYIVKPLSVESVQQVIEGLTAQA
ncbi:MAG: response regulator [Acidobacteria bacterium]|nr:response regulator [Acidobacteriota bacterium]